MNPLLQVVELQESWRSASMESLEAFVILAGMIEMPGWPAIKQDLAFSTMVGLYREREREIMQS